MLRRRRAATGTARRDGAPADLDPERVERGLSQDAPVAGETHAEPHQTRTLETPCVCGHTRREHTGLRMAFNGRCLECDCEAFTVSTSAAQSEDELVRRMRAVIARVERLQELARGLSPARESVRNGRAGSR